MLYNSIIKKQVNNVIETLRQIINCYIILVNITEAVIV